MRYGYQHGWWLWPEADRAISALGVYGQHLVVDFDDRVVIVQTANWNVAARAAEANEAQALHAAIIAALR
jgi:CubicO group peptidase (beta-lactamase class C family)